MNPLSAPSRLSSAFSQWIGNESASLVFLLGSSGLEPAVLFPKLLEWKERLSAHPLSGRFFSPPLVPRTEWGLSRSALVSALEETLSGALAQGSTANRPFRLSLSHSGKGKTPAAVAVAFSSASGEEVGVDLEPEDRAVSEAAFRRFHLPQELKIEASPIIHWVLKEACWKAHRHSVSTVISEYEILEKRELEYRLRCVKNGTEFRAVLFREEGFLIAIAATD